MTGFNSDKRSAFATSRRNMLKYSTAAGASSLLAAGLSRSGLAAANRLAAQEVNVPAGTFAGVNNTVIVDYAVPLFEESHPDVNLEISVRAAAENYPRLLASPDRPTEAVGMWNDTFSALGSQADLFAEFDEANVPNRADAIQDVQPANGLGMAVAVQPYGIAFNPDLVEKPTSWLDLFKPEYEGKVVMHENFWDQYIMLAHVLGADETNLEVAIDEWEKHKKNIGVWTTSFTQLQELVDKGEMWLGPQWGGFTVAAQRSGLNIDFSWPDEGATQQSIIVHVNNGWDDDVRTAAEQFANVWLDPAVQEGFLNDAGLSPTNSTVEIPEEFAAYDGVITPERLQEKTLIAYDYGYVGEHLTEITQMINEKLK